MRTISDSRQWRKDDIEHCLVVVDSVDVTIRTYDPSRLRQRALARVRKARRMLRSRRYAEAETLACEALSLIFK